MRKKHIVTMIAAAMMSLAAAMTSLAADGSWQNNGTGWWWDNGDGTWPVNSWSWIDGNRDGVAECYYFGADGYLLTNATAPDGSTVNADGAWIENGVVKTKTVGLPAATTGQTLAEEYNEYGVSLTAIDMLKNSREENAAKYGEVYAYFEWEVDYSNGFTVSYLEDYDMDRCVSNLSDTKKLFKYYDESFYSRTNPDSAREFAYYLRDKGFDNIYVSSDGELYWIELGNGADLS